MRADSSQRCGAAGELIAAKHLRSLGHEILAQNWRHPSAELDIVSQTTTHLVVTEVKTTSAQNYGLERRFSAYARARQRLAAQELAGRLHKQARLDLIEVRLDLKNARFDLKRLQNL